MPTENFDSWHNFQWFYIQPLEKQFWIITVNKWQQHMSNKLWVLLKNTGTLEFGYFEVVYLFTILLKRCTMITGRYLAPTSPQKPRTYSIQAGSLTLVHPFQLSHHLAGSHVEEDARCGGLSGLAKGVGNLCKGITGGCLVLEDESLGMGLCEGNVGYW